MNPAASNLREPGGPRQQVMIAQPLAQPQVNGIDGVPRIEEPTSGLAESHAEPSSSAAAALGASRDVQGNNPLRVDSSATTSRVEEVRPLQGQAEQQASVTIPDAGQDRSRELGGAAVSSASYGSFRTPRSTASPPPVPWAGGFEIPRWMSRLGSYLNLY